MAIAVQEFELVARLRARDVGAFEDLVHGYSPRVRWWAGGILRDPCEVEDVIQEVLSSTWRAAPGLRPDTALAPWLKTVTLNAARKRLRSPRGGVASLELVREHPGEQADPGVDERVDVHAALGRLPDRESQILQLLYLDSLTMEEAASTLGVSEEAAKSLAARARRRFRKMFRDWFSAASSFAVAPLRWLGQVPEIVGNAGGAAGFAAGTAIALAVAVAPSSAPPDPLPAGDASTAEAAHAAHFRELLGLPVAGLEPETPSLGWRPSAVSSTGEHPRRPDPPGDPVRAGDPAGPPEGRPQGPPAPPPGQGGSQPPGQAKTGPGQGQGPGQGAQGAAGPPAPPPGQGGSQPPGQAKTDPPGQGQGAAGPPAPPPGQGGSQPPGQAKTGPGQGKGQGDQGPPASPPGQGSAGQPPSQGGKGSASDPPGKGPGGPPQDAGQPGKAPSGQGSPGKGGGPKA